MYNILYMFCCLLCFKQLFVNLVKFTETIIIKFKRTDLVFDLQLKNEHFLQGITIFYPNLRCLLKKATNLVLTFLADFLWVSEQEAQNLDF